MRFATLASLATIAVIFSTAVHAEDAKVRVADVGNGLCVVLTFPSNFDMLYDAGDRNGKDCLRSVREMVDDKRIELIVLSHNDADHIGELPNILHEKDAGVLIHTGNVRTTATYRSSLEAMGKDLFDGATIINLGTYALAPGSRFLLGDASVTFIAGWKDWDQRLGRLTEPSELANAISIVTKVEYGGKALLLTGDTVGQKNNAPGTVCAYAERAMVTNPNLDLRADVLVASHHGGDDASTRCFIDTVRPKFVIFSAGNKGHIHPRQTVAKRFIDAQVHPQRIFTTDRGDDEGEKQWNVGRVPQCVDKPGDDDVEIRIPAEASGPIQVAYRLPQTGC